MKVKICGITQRKDAEQCDALEVDYLGFNFYRLSKRYILPEKARDIIPFLKRAKPVGVFVEQDLDYIKGIVDMCNLYGIQIHGSENSEFCYRIKKLFPDRMVIQVFRIKETIPSNLNDFDADYYLFDSFDDSSPGGTGKTFDWTVLQKMESIAQRSFIAGGINPENVKALISCVDVYGIDVASGVEKVPGIKDMEKVRQLLVKTKGCVNDKIT
ncbi:MAG TPA: phosphoribosylanthranilate isomerase [bacterium]|nr:phosphoribosylanthranilate isomerase [bacterium]HOL49167.1 phosphoribosylanthranilate isomerase [bacterium]HPO51496.1 phosphoribosylanthranilate isomerase [bacterium]HXK44585.1 phosphoribosylanthranilate isomerase [bacterium]